MMAKKIKPKSENPWDNANPLSKLLFLWVIPLLKNGSKSNLNFFETFQPPKDYLSKRLAEEAVRNWENECSKSKKCKRRPKMFFSLWASHWKTILLTFTTAIICECILRILPVLVLGRFVNSFNLDSSQRKYQYIYGTIICLFPLINNLLLYTAIWSVQRVGFACRVALSALVFRKTLRMPQSTEKQKSIGHLVNLLSNDLGRFDSNLYLSISAFVIPIQFCILMYFLYNTFPIGAAIGVTFVLVLTPAQYFNGKLSRRFRQIISKLTDERGRIMNEVVGAITVIKMYAWEKAFAAIISTIRRFEVEALGKETYLKGFLNIVSSVMLKFIPYAAIMMIVVLGDEINSGKIYFAIAIYHIMCENMFRQFPIAITWLGELSNTLNRIEEYLLAEEKQQYIHYERVSFSKKTHSPQINMKNVTARRDNGSYAINGINMHLLGNKLVVIVGAIGNGKTSLLNAIISELELSSGECTVNGKISYCSQEPWIFNGSVRQNILFGTAYNNRRYEEVVTTCALIEDFKQFPYGDKTFVGEKGISLSGGQKARINLARALYREADIYLLDDPLSAVDSRVSRHIFEKSIQEFLRGKLRILVTHQIQYLPFADHIVVLNKGTILDQGNYDELVEIGLDIPKLVPHVTADVSPEGIVETAGDTGFPKKTSSSDYKEQSEMMKEGSVATAVYWSYFQLGGNMFQMAFIGILTIVTQILQRSADYLLSFWTTLADKERQDELKFSSTLQNLTSIKVQEIEYSSQALSYFYIYTTLVAFFIVCCAAKIYLHFNYSLKISSNLYSKMFSSLIRAPLKFYDKNSSGRIMNRCTSDIGIFDAALPPLIYNSIDYCAQLVGTVFIVSISNYYFVFPCAVIFSLLWTLRQVYTRTSRNAKRTESIAKSPIYTHLSTSIYGISTIRAFGHQEQIINEFDSLLDAHSSAWFIVMCTGRAFGAWIDQISIIFLCLVTFSFLTFAQDASSGNVGLLITSVMGLLTTLQWGVRQASETETFMTSVERALEYTHLESEAPLESQKDLKPPEDWPKNGSIQFRNVSLSYNHGESYVLRNINIDIKAEEKIGVVGRTGAGKSSIISALFRLTEPEGNIYIDGILINQIGLHDLRKGISIIPQDPVLFSGTIRYNLDPFGNFEDADLMKVVEEVQLREVIDSLELQVTGGGSNFSVGERQLLCLARAILRKNKIIVMDEATSSVDPKTDNFIQSTIRTKFSDCSIITIAHRLHTIMDSDRLLVVENGTIQEFDHPYVLLQNPNGVLSSLVGHVRGEERLKLFKIAQESYLLSHLSHG